MDVDPLYDWIAAT